MSSQKPCLSVSSTKLISVFCLVLCFTGFIRIEVKFNDQEQRLLAVEQSLATVLQEIADPSLKGKNDYFQGYYASSFMFQSM